MLTAMPQEHERGVGGWQAEWATLAGAGAADRGVSAINRHSCLKVSKSTRRGCARTSSQRMD
jgi:adenylosuccinate lyase